MNLRKESIRLVSEPTGKFGDDISLSINCNLDIEVSSHLELSVVRKQQRVLRRLVRINQTGIGVSATVNIITPEETK